MDFEACSPEVRSAIEAHLPAFRERLVTGGAAVGMEAFDVVVRPKGNGAFTVTVRSRVQPGEGLGSPTTAEFELQPVQEQGQQTYRSTDVEFAVSAL